jgi:hypothetical protein
MDRNWVRTLVYAALLFGAASLSDAAALPDYAPPPGAVNPQVTQANISQTVCVRGWTKTVRPPVQYTNRLKRAQMRQRGLPGVPSDYEEDHYIPLEIGGHPTDPKNLWPQRWPEARLKDKLENALHAAVCGGKMTLSAAQHCLLDQSWGACARRMGTPTP